MFVLLECVWLDFWLCLICVNLRLPPGPAVHAWCWGTSDLSTSPVLLLFICSYSSSTFIFCCCSFLPLSVHAPGPISGCTTHLPQTSFLGKPAGFHCTPSFLHHHSLLLSSSLLFGSLIPAWRAGFSHGLPPTSTNRTLRYSDWAWHDPSLPENRSASQLKPLKNVSKDSLWPLLSTRTANTSCGTTDLTLQDPVRFLKRVLYQVYWLGFIVSSAHVEAVLDHLGHCVIKSLCSPCAT